MSMVQDQNDPAFESTVLQQLRALDDETHIDLNILTPVVIDGMLQRVTEPWAMDMSIDNALYVLRDEQHFGPLDLDEEDVCTTIELKYATMTARAGKMVRLLGSIREDDENSMLEGTSTITQQSRRETVEHTMGTLFHGCNMLLNAAALRACVRGRTRMPLELRVPLMFINPDDQTNTRLLQYVANKMMWPCKPLRLYKDNLYCEIFTEPTDGTPGYATYAWKVHMTLVDFVNQVCSAGVNADAWKMLTGKSFNLAQQFIARLQEDRIVTRLEFSEHLFAFRNGLFDVKAIMFYEFGNEASWESWATFATNRARQYANVAKSDRRRAYWRNVQYRAPTRQDVAVKYFDHIFPVSCKFNDVTTIDVESIPCPAFQKIVDFQRFEKDTIYWFMAMLGRLLHKTGMDDWQVMLFLKGVAGCGKSTILLLMESLFLPDRVGTLESEGEVTFGLGPLVDKSLVVCPEVKRKFNLPQGTLQSMITGESVSAAVKYKDPKQVKWETPLLFAGNELPNWTDASDSMARRIFMIIFSRRVTNVDTDLNEQLQQEIANFLLRISITYQQTLIAYGHGGLWGLEDNRPIVSQEIWGFREKLKTSVQALARFLETQTDFALAYKSPELDENELYVPERVFLDHYSAWCKANGVSWTTWNEDQYGTIFETYGLDLREAQVYWDGTTQRTRVIFGIGIPPTEEDNQES